MAIIAIGDIHEELKYKELIKDEILDASAVIITGDLTQFGGIKEAAEVLTAFRQLNPNILALAGNLDHPDVEQYFAGIDISLHGRGRMLDDIGFFGVGGCNPSPFNTPNELEEVEIARLLEKGYEEIKDAPYKIMVPHMPPYNSRMDIIHSGIHVGSHSVRQFIEKNQPDICLTGHIHEAVGDGHIGITHILNPGPFGEGGYVKIENDGNKLRAELRFLV